MPTNHINVLVPQGTLLEILKKTQTQMARTRTQMQGLGLGREGLDYIIGYNE
jgi:hypothetical protein